MFSPGPTCAADLSPQSPSPVRGRDAVADVPRTDDIEAAEYFCPARIFLLAPRPLAAAHQSDSVARVLFEEVDDAVGQGRVKPLAEESPHGQHRPAIVMEIARIGGDLHLVHEPFPIGRAEVEELSR